MIIGFTMFRFFSDGTEQKRPADNPQDTASVAQDVAGEDINTGNDIADNHTNSDSVDFILHKKKQEEQQDVSSQPEPTAESKKPATKKPTPKTDQAVADKISGKPAQKIKQDSSNNTSVKPVPIPPQPGDGEEDDVADISPGQPIVLRGHGLPVMLVLQENINKQTASEGQHVSFKVVEPAMLKGNVIIPPGSVINGTIKGLGSRRMSIIFNMVHAKGRQMRLDRSEAGASMENVFSGNTFRVNLRGVLNP
ncbi:hypothetical protein [Parafilimonas sp.]|uniref:hypothetical protein n=1 Tax=Parafilimonas sp. TaxID=1969739 RepID=UPI0039E460D7